jgi:nucleotide-binding universal stress UspA family protein
MENAVAAAIRTLLPVDGSEHALAAVRHALRTAADPSAASFVLVNVQEPASLYEVMVAHDAERIAALRREAGADLLRPAEALLDDAGAAYESEVAGGAPEHLIIELAERYGCDAIVMGALGLDVAPGTHGLGTVAQAVAAASELPVTLVRAPAVESDLQGGPDTEPDTGRRSESGNEPGNPPGPTA